MAEKWTAHLLLTARRAFPRLLRQEIRTDTDAEEEAEEELREIFRQVAG